MIRILAVAKDWIKAFLWAFVIIISLRIFTGEILTISSSSMQNTLMPGDAVFVSKLAYGPRLPMTPLSIPFTHQNFSDGKAYLNWISLPYIRLGNVRSVKRNDLIVFNYPKENEHPIDHRTKFVKRCVALPGDQLSISNKKLFVNDSVQPDSFSLFNYHWTTRQVLSRDSMSTLKIPEYGRINSEKEWSLSISRQMASHLNTNPETESLKELFEEKTATDPYIFPYVKTGWNRDNFGPIEVPAKKDTIWLNPQNIDFYREIIEKYEGNILEVEGSEIIINGTIRAYYLPDQDYFFVLGDNRDNSSDSRFWGFLPESHIIGKVKLILFRVSEEGNLFEKIRMNRFFKSID